MIYDFHTHTSLSDGSLSPLELIRRASNLGYRAIALTDHLGIGSLRRVIEEVSHDCALARAHWNILAIPGVELTHVPPKAIAETAQKAKELGACLVIVHGETLVEPVEKGTNLAALQCPYVDILAHPGLLTLEEGLLAAKNQIFLEISTRKGHSLTNSHVAYIAQKTNAKLLLNSDAHNKSELLAPELVNKIAKGIGLDNTKSQELLIANSLLLINKISSKIA